MSTPTTQSSRPKPKPNLRGAPSEKSHPRAPGLPSGRSMPKDSSSSSPLLRMRGEREAENERLFWSGGKPPRSFDKSNSLLDEELDMNSVDGLMSPPPPISSASRVPTTSDEDGDDTADGLSARGTDDEDDDASGSGEPTIVISKLRLEPTSTAPPSPPPSRPESQSSVVEPQTPAQVTNATTGTIPPPSIKTKVRRVRITADVERVCVSDTLSHWSSFHF